MPLPTFPEIRHPLALGEAFEAVPEAWRAEAKARVGYLVMRGRLPSDALKVAVAGIERDAEEAHPPPLMDAVPELCKAWPTSPRDLEGRPRDAIYELAAVLDGFVASYMESPDHGDFGELVSAYSLDPRVSEAAMRACEAEFLRRTAAPPQPPPTDDFGWDEDEPDAEGHPDVPDRYDA